MEDDNGADYDNSTPGFEWSYTSLNTLITLFSNEAILWDTTSYDYHNRDTRQSAYERIAGPLGCGVEEVIRKLRHLRTYYARELAKVKKSLRTGRPHVSRWTWFDKLDFLREHITTQQTRASSQSNQRPSAELEFSLKKEIDSASQSSESSGCEAQRRRKKSVPVKQQQRSTANGRSNAKRPLADDTPPPPTVDGDSVSDADDPDMVFGRHVANELKLISNHKAKQFAKLQIHSILFNAQFGLTSVPSDVIGALTSTPSAQAQ